MNRQSNIRMLFIAGVIGALLIAFFVGRSSSRSTPTVSSATPAPQVTATAQKIWTCSMHSQIRLKEPGKCPICGMPLIPANDEPSTSNDSPTLQLSDHALAMASIETTSVQRKELARELLAVGKIEYNEATLANVTARVDGYVEQLFVDFTGVEIKSGDHLADIYSPELLVAQQELLIALQGGTTQQGSNTLIDTSSLKLRRWGLTEAQVKELIEQKKISDHVTLLSPIDGTVIEKSIVKNSAFKAGDALYRVANLDSVWVYLDIYEYDFAWVKYGQQVEITAEALPGRVFSGTVTFVQPFVTEQTRTVRIPVHIENKDHTLKPGMFVSARISASLTAAGSAAPTGVEGKYACPMHRQIIQDEPGVCPLCGMKLERIPDATTQSTTPLVVPITAVLDSGTRRIVYVEKSRGLFEAREITVGPRASEFFPVLKGLSENERVVTRGGFLIDSQFQISGHPSLFYPGGLAAGAAVGHQHGGSAPQSTDNALEPKHQH